MRAQSALAGAAVPLAILWLAASTAGPAAAQLTSFRAQLFTESDLLFYGPASDDEFGYALAAGDFDGDGADDLATGIPFDENLGGLFPDSGIVVVRYGVPGAGLAGGLADDVLSQFTGGSPDPVAEGDCLGMALAVGDFNADGFDDLAVGAPGDGWYHLPNGVQVHYGSAAGLDLVGTQFFSEATPGVPGDPSGWGCFGRALAVGDFEADGRDDLAIGNPCATSGSAAAAGAIVVLSGSTTGLTVAGARRIDQDTPGMTGENEWEDKFGAALASGDFDGDGFDDLAVGVPGEDDGAGHVHELFGGATGLTVEGNQYWDQADPGVSDEPEAGDAFGAALAAADFDGDDRDDLAIGVPGEDLDTSSGATADAGAVEILRGSATGLTATGSQFWTQDSPGIQEMAEFEDRFGGSLAAGDFAHDGVADLAIGARGEDIGAGPFDGAVHVLAGRSDFGGLVALGNQLWHQESPGVPGNGEQGDEFGRALAVGDFDASGHQDLAIGGPRESTDGLHGNGAEWVLYGSLFADGFESGSAGRWSSVVP